MPLTTPFHPRIQQLCTEQAFKIWAGYLAPRRYGPAPDEEYHAYRHAAGLLDISPLCKYEVRGSDAGEFISYLFTREVASLRPGRVLYGAFCNHRGLMVDDGTVTRLPDGRYRITTASPALHWFELHRRGFDATVEDASRSLAALAVQGPASREILAGVAGSSIKDLRFFHAGDFRIAGVPVEVSRTGYTGDIGYEIWIPAKAALSVYDAVLEEGSRHGLAPAGLDALDVARIEAGFIMQDVEYKSAPLCESRSQAASPLEVRLDWAVERDRGPFLGDRALQEIAGRGPSRVLCGLEIDGEAVERSYESAGLFPRLPVEAFRAPAPILHRGREAGYVTSRAWSPLLKRYLALGFLPPDLAEPGGKIRVQLPIDKEIVAVPGTVVELPFLDAKRKRG